MNAFSSFLVLCVLTLVGTGTAHASKEGVLSLGTFQVSSLGIGQSGPVIVSGARTGEVVTSLCVQAFNQTKCLTKEQLAMLSGGIVNGVQISYEAGYQKLGGRTVYVLLSKGFTSERLDGKLVSITEAGQVAVEDAPAK